VDYTENTFPSSSIVSSRSYRTNRIENTVPKNTACVTSPLPKDGRPSIVACTYVAGVFTELLSRNVFNKSVKILKGVKYLIIQNVACLPHYNNGVVSAVKIGLLK
jgi:hypothetical protein